jgi:hypothetical protein
MLRHIFSLSLAMIGCAVLIPTKVNAATLTVRPSGEIQAKPGDLIDFTFSLVPAKDSVVIPTGWASLSDSSELSPLTEPQYLVSLNAPISYDSFRSKDIIRQRFTVLKPLKDGIGDVWGTLTYDESGPFGVFTGLSISESGADVVPVPEPVTMFGTAIGLGCGVLFKRKSSKKAVS